MEFKFSTTYEDPLSPFNTLPLNYFLELEEKAFANYPDQEHRMKRVRIVEHQYLWDVEPLIYHRRVKSPSKIYAEDPLYFYLHFYSADFRTCLAVLNYQRLDTVIVAKIAIVIEISFSLSIPKVPFSGFNSFMFHTR